MFLHLSVILFMGGCLADIPPGRPPQPNPIQQMATAVNGTHPTEMHSCYNLFLKKLFNDKLSGYQKSAQAPWSSELGARLGYRKKNLKS